MQSRLLAQAKKISIEIVKNSTAHGIPRLFTNNLFSLKIIWFICFLASTCACSYFLYRSVSSFLAHEVVITVKVVSTTCSLFFNLYFYNQFSLIKICDWLRDWVFFSVCNYLKPKNTMVIQITCEKTRLNRASRRYKWWNQKILSES